MPALDQTIHCPDYALALLPLPEAAAVVLEPLHALAAAPAVSASMEWLPHTSHADTEAFFAFCAHDRTQRTGFHFALQSTGPACAGTPAGTVLGVASLFALDHHLGRGEISTWLGEAYWGRGLNKQAKHALFEIAFAQLGLHKVVMRVAVDNTASIRAHTKLHTALEGTLRGELLIRGRRTDCRYYGLLAEEYRAHYAPLRLASGP